MFELIILSDNENTLSNYDFNLPQSRCKCEEVVLLGGKGKMMMLIQKGSLSLSRKITYALICCDVCVC